MFGEVVGNLRLADRHSLRASVCSTDAKFGEEMSSWPRPFRRLRLLIQRTPSRRDGSRNQMLRIDPNEAEVVVFKPLGAEKFKVVARVAAPYKWTEWAKSSGSKPT